MFTFRKFAQKSNKKIIKALGHYLYLENNKKVLDFTSGWTGFASLGHGHPKILDAVKKQMKKYSHIDYNEFNNPLIEKLSKNLNLYSKKNYKVWYSGNSGSESVEAAMKLSYQVHCAQGNEKKIKYIHRSQSFHGATFQPLLVSSIDIFDIYKNLQTKNYIEVPQHNSFATCYASKNSCKCGKDPMSCMGKRVGESNEQYLERSIYEIENTIKKNNPNKICAFIGETQLAPLVGDVPPLKNYWSKVSNICKKYNIHLILDEVYCGMGRSGKMFNFEWDNCDPDFTCIGKNTTSGVIPFSFVLSKSKYQDIIIKKLGRVSLGHTFQGHSLGAAATIKLLQIIKEENLLDRVNSIGKKLRKIIFDELKNHENFKNVRGRGFAYACEYNFKKNNDFGLNLKKIILEKNKILLNSKWHRVSFLPSYNTPSKLLYDTTEIFIDTFKKLSKNKKFH